MKILWLVPVISLFLSNCAVYKELQPKSPPSNKEQGYQELNRKEAKKFEIDKDKKYFITFPASEEDHYYLVLKVANKNKLESFFTDSLHKKSTPGAQIKDETEKPDSVSVYAINKGKPAYYWLINKVPEDMELNLDYRYVPQWRYKYENKYALYNQTYENNRVERKTYAEIGKSIPVEKLNTNLAIDTVQKHITALETVYQELLAIEKIFPPSILNSKDTAYQNYVKLKKDTEDELTFQGKFISALKYFQKIQQVKGNPTGFLDNVALFNAYFARKPAQDSHVLAKSQELLKEGLKEVIAFYDQRLEGKKDATPFDPKLYRLKDFEQVMALYDTSGVGAPKEVKQLSSFITDFNENANNLTEVSTGYNDVREVVKGAKGYPKPKYFAGQAQLLGQLEAKAPKAMGTEYGKYTGFPSAAALNEEATALGDKIEKTKKNFVEAEELVLKINPLIEAKTYSEALSLVKDKNHLPFLLNLYKPLDKQSVEHQATQIGEALAKFSWGAAEAGLTSLHQDQNFIDPEGVESIKKSKVSDMEDSLYIKVDVLTRSKVNKFVEERWNELIHVDSLYSDSVFLPAYDVKFTTGGKDALLKRKDDLTAHLAKLKENEFPAKAIKLLYQEFLKRPSDKGVLKARAVVSHGKHYKGKDKEIKRRIHECDPWGPKWIVKPTKYRRVFALPITTKKGENTYLVRLNIRAKTDAKFPVYDVNIKLPKEVAKSAGKNKWFDKITLDKKELKSEGRFTITTPSADNGYECQITPVRMKKDKNNFLDIYFKHKSLTVLPISVMVQKPLIKKN